MEVAMIELFLIPLVLIIFVPGVIVGIVVAVKMRKWRR
jgi:hypothetical protein